MTNALKPWPYPRWVAHRGAGKLAPENTMSAFRLGAQHGYRFFECDAKLSQDGVLFLMHDATLERTTNGHGIGGALSMGEIAQLDAGSWHSRAYAGEALPTLEALARWCLANHLHLNVEIKPTPGQELETGRACGELMQRIWPKTEVQPLFTSFKSDSLKGARETAAHIPRGLLVDRLADGNGDAQAVTGGLQRVQLPGADRHGRLACHTGLIAGQRQLGKHHQFGAKRCSLFDAGQMALQVG